MLFPALLILAGLVAPDDPVLTKQEGPMARVFQAARESGRPVLIDFSTEWCRWCKVMDRDVFTEPSVVELANGRFLLFCVDAEKGEGVALAKRYRVTVYPTYVFTDAEGREFDRKVGSEDAEGFLAFMKDVLAGNHAAGLLAKSNASPEDGELQALAGARLARAGDPRCRVHLEKAIALDPRNERASTVAARYWVAARTVDSETASRETELARFAQRFPDSPEAVLAHRDLAKDYEAKGDWANQKASLEFVARRAPEPWGLNDLAWFLATRGQELDRALALVDRALVGRPGYHAFLDTRAECLSRLGRHADAVASQEKALANFPAGSPAEERKEYEDHFAQIRAAADAARAPGPGVGK